METSALGPCFILVLSSLDDFKILEMTRVLVLLVSTKKSRAPLKGLKENIILGDMAPIRTGSREVICQLNVEK